MQCLILLSTFFHETIDSTGFFFIFMICLLTCFLCWILPALALSLHFSGAPTVLSLNLHSFSTKLGSQDYCLAIKFKIWVLSLKWNSYFFDIPVPLQMLIYPQNINCHCLHYNSPSAHKTKHFDVRSFALFPSVVSVFTWQSKSI